jgi:CRP-like cAMP-binding protein
MSNLLDRCTELPVREVTAGEVLISEGRPAQAMYVLIDGSFDVTNQGSRVATITEPGAVIGEISVLLDTAPGATVVAVEASKVHVVDEPLAFMVGDPAALLAVARTLAGRLDRLVGYLADVKAQYASAGGHMELLDGILAELAFGEQPAVDSGSDRDPDPYY